MSLEALLAARRERAMGRLKPEHKEKQDRHIAELRASGAVERALRAGARAPEFALPNQRGETVTLAGLRARGPLVISFFRGSWCSYCVAELEALEEIVAAVRALGADLVAISPERPDRTAMLIDQKKFSFDILVDDGCVVAGAYGLAYEFPEYLRDLYRDVFRHDVGGTYNHDRIWHLPMPGRFVIDASGVARKAEVDADYRHRPEPAETLDVIRGLVAPVPG